MEKYTIYKREVKAIKLTGRVHKIIIGPKIFGKAQNMSFGTADFPPHSHAPTHVHPKEEEIIYILTAKGEMYFDGKPEAIKKGTCVYIPLRVRHSINNKSDEIMKVVYGLSPPVAQGSYEEK